MRVVTKGWWTLREERKTVDELETGRPEPTERLTKSANSVGTRRTGIPGQSSLAVASLALASLCLVPNTLPHCTTAA
jgi:hypothetical protein